MTNYERIQLVVLSYNRSDYLPRLFEELLLPAAKQGILVTVVDNCSKQPVRQYLSQFANIDNIGIVFNESNFGVAKGRNTGFKQSSREFVVSLDDDAIISLDALVQVPGLFDQFPEAGILAFRIVHGTTGEAQNEHGGQELAVGNFHGAGHAIRRSLFDQVGYLDENCFFGAEEIEFSMRGLTAGMESIYTPAIIVRHYSLKYNGKDNLKRCVNWSRNYAMAIYRYLPPAMATLFNLRLLVSDLLVGFINFNFGVILLPLEIIQGAIKGLQTRNPLNAKGIVFYSNPDLRPEIGNVSIISKVRRRLRLIKTEQYEPQKVLLKSSQDSLCDQGKHSLVKSNSPSTDQKPEITIIVLSHNRLDDLKKNIPFLAGYCEQSGSQFIVVDNASNLDVQNYLTEMKLLHPVIHVIQNETNKGVAGGRNTGFAVARGKYIVSLDDDTNIPAAVLNRIPCLFEKNPQAGILAFRVRHPLTMVWENPHGENPCYVANHHGAGCAIRGEVIEKLGGIDPLCRFGSEEIDLCIRTKDMGLGVLFCPDCIVWHNSINQKQPIKAGRMELRAYNNARVMHKYFSIQMARRLANRYLLSDFSHTLPAFKLALSFRLFRASLRGRKEGIRHHQQVSAETEMFYSDPCLQPDFGNFPLSAKFISKIKKIFSGSAKNGDVS